jgi:hypothetical protein
METDPPDEVDDYEVRAAPPGYASQGGTGEMVVLPGRRPRAASGDTARGSETDEPTEAD